MATFTYSRLGADFVRLLKIHSLELSKTDSNCLELVHVLESDLENTQYEAVSYVWGSPERNEDVEFADGSHLKITITLRQALPYLIAASKTGLLWIDQLCINQDNNEEKSQQVPKMGQIYARAKRTLAWLGIVPTAQIRFSDLMPNIHKELDTWIKIHGEDPLLECSDGSASHVSAFDIYRQIIHHRRTSKKSDWDTMLEAILGIGFQSQTGNWFTGTRFEQAGYLHLPYRMNGNAKDYQLQIADGDNNEIHKDLILDHKAENTSPEDLEISKREDSLIFYCYCAVVAISTALAKGKPNGLTPSLDTIIKSLRPFLEHILSHPWSTRVWIMQEVKLSNSIELLVNNETFEPRAFLRLHDLLRFCCSATGNTISEVRIIRRAKWSDLFSKDQNYRAPLSIHLIRRMEKSPAAIEKASDPRDLIYGLLPVCKSEPHLPATNYALEVPEVFAAATRYFLARHDSLWVLQFCSDYRTRQSLDDGKSWRFNLPSWVPDWSGPSLMEPLSSSYYPNIFRGVPRCETHNDGRFFMCAHCGDGGISYSAAGQRKYVAMEEGSSDVLTIRGKVINEVIDLVFEPDDAVWGHQLTGIFHLASSENRFLSQIDEAFTEITERTTRFRHVTPPLERKDILEFLLINPYLYQPFAFRTDHLSMEDVLRYAEQDDGSNSEFLQPKLRRKHFSLLFGRNFALTDDGFYFGPDTMQIGDKIAIIHGSEFPLVLRPVDNDEKTYRFVGQCMVRDRRIMFGDAVNWEENDAQIFRLV